MQPERSGFKILFGANVYTGYGNIHPAMALRVWGLGWLLGNADVERSQRSLSGCCAQVLRLVAALLKVPALILWRIPNELQV